jgi:site-specific DNA-methyltransferase (adenine-specific)
MTREFTNEDCMDLMARYEDKHFDLAIIDPPYGLGVANQTYLNYKNPNEKEDRIKKGKKVRGQGLAIPKNYKISEWDKKTPDIEYFNELIRVSKNQIIFGANHFISKIPYDSSCWIVWDKKTEANFADCELAWTSFKSAVRKFEFMWAGMLQGDMKNKETRIHPTQKPLALYKWLLKNYAKEGDLILDTHVGSASSLIACEEMGFDYVGCELDKDYFEMACKRIDTYRQQLKLF